MAWRWISHNTYAGYLYILRHRIIFKHPIIIYKSTCLLNWLSITISQKLHVANYHAYYQKLREQLNSWNKPPLKHNKGVQYLIETTILSNGASENSNGATEISIAATENSIGAVEFSKSAPYHRRGCTIFQE